MVKGSQQDISELVAAVRGAQPQKEGIVPGNIMQIVVMAAMGACGALVWNNATSQPTVLTEIRTTVLEMKTTLGDIQTRLDNNTRATADQQAKISGLESQVKSNSDRLDRLERGLQDDRGYRSR